MEYQKLKLDLARVECGKLELEYRILEHQQKIDQLKESIGASDLKINEINERIKTFKG